MLRNYCKVIFRNLRRYKTYTIINVVGMGIGIAAMIWGFQAYLFSFSFDNFHQHQDDVYRALAYNKNAEGLQGMFPMAAVQSAKNDLSGIKEAARYTRRGVNIKYDKGETFSERVNFTDPSFFDMFNFALIAGDHDIKDPNAVLISEKIAKKYFGGKNPIGKVLTFYADANYARPLTVRGVLKDIPVNSTLQFDIISNFDNLLLDNGKKIASDDWGSFIEAAFFYIPDPSKVARLEKEMTKYLPVQNKAREDAKVTGFRLATIRQNAQWLNVVGSNGLYERPGDAPTYGPLVLAFLIFLSSCLNFSNTTVAHASKRLKEIGMRKVMGSTYPQLIGQLLAECFIIVAGAILLSILLNSWWLPVFNKMFIGIRLNADYFHDTKLQIFIGCMLVGATLLAGTYPAFYISRFNPTSIFRGTVRFGGSNLFSRVMLSLQLSIAIITVIAAIAFARNASFQRNFDYGYAIESNLGLRLNDTTAYAAMRDQLSSLPGITSLAGTGNHIGFDYRNAIAQSDGLKKEVSYLEIGRGYTQTMELKLMAGREFDASMGSDYATGLLITERTAALYGWSVPQAVGKRIRIDNTDYSVVGVLKDFHSGDMFEETLPIALKLVKEDRFRYLVIQARSTALTAVFKKVEAVWKRLYPLRPFNGFYQNELKAEAYATNDSVATIFFWFGMVSVLLTTIGLFALVSLTTVKKMKEIALRKVVGAGTLDILVLVNEGYFWIFIVSVLVGCAAGWALTKTLLDLIFKTNVGVSPGSLIWAVIVLFVIAALTSGIKVWQAARTNPADLLRAE